jgi:lipopolysaccharide export system protein LptA
MSRSVRPPNQTLLWARNIGLGFLAFLGVRTVYVNVYDLIARDPFAELRKEEETGLGQDVGVQLKDVRMKAYHTGQLVTSIQSDVIQISKDRQTFTLQGIHDGLYHQDADVYRYEATNGIWNASARHLAINGAVRIQTADMDLRTSDVQFDQPEHSLSTLRLVSGRLYHGSIKADTFRMDTKSHEYTTGAIDYRGDLAMLQKNDTGDDGPVSKTWHVTGDMAKGSRSKRYYVRGRAEDDEMILKADLVNQDLKNDVIVATGNVKYYSAKADITADEATVFHKERRVILTGHVTIFIKPKSEQNKPPVEEATPEFKRVPPDKMIAGTLVGVAEGAPKELATKDPLSKPPLQPANGVQAPGSGAPPTKAPVPASQPQKKPATAGPLDGKKPAPQTAEEKQLDDELRSGKSIRQYPMIIVCDKVDYFYRKGDRHGHVTGNPEAHQDLPAGRWRYAWSNTADYDAEKDELTLVSTPKKLDLRMKNSKGDDLTAQDLTVSTKEDSDEEDYHGRKVSGTVLSDSDEDTGASGKKAPAGEKSATPPIKTAPSPTTKTSGT